MAPEIAAAGERLKSRIHARKIEAPGTLIRPTETSLADLIDEALGDVVAPDGTPFPEWADREKVKRGDR